MSDLIISVSGMRGIVGHSLTTDVAWRYAAALAQVLPAGPVVVARDGRANGPQLVPPVIAGLSQNGVRNVLDAGIAATPTVGVLVRERRCAGGVQISASHNPAEYNGLKLFTAEGRVAPAAIGQQVLERFHQLEISATGVSLPPPRPKWLDDTTSAHLALVEETVDIARIRTRGFRVVVDANHGSGGMLARLLLEQLGCDVRLVGGEPDGHFAHPPEPTAENLFGVLADVTRLRADVGFCQDPDADRLAIIDETGRYLGEEYTLAMCADHVVRRTPGALVMNCSTSRMTEDVARKYDLPFYRTPVGEANVVDKMLQCDAVFGGEGNGGVIDPRVGLVRDSFVGMALVLDAMAGREMAVSALANELPRYAIHKTKLALERAKIPAAFAALEHEYSTARVDRTDGLRLDWGNPDGSGSWLHLRASNTEPIVRLIAEAPTADGALRLCELAENVVAKVA